MDEVITDYMNRLAFYRGHSRWDSFDSEQAYKIVAQRRHPDTGEVTAVCFENGEWVAVGSIEVVPGSVMRFDDMDQIFGNAAGGPREQIKHEIERLEARLAELRTAIKVIDSL
jgi:hypothetical protein